MQLISRNLRTSLDNMAYSENVGTEGREHYTETKIVFKSNSSTDDEERSSGGEDTAASGYVSYQWY